MVYLFCKIKLDVIDLKQKKKRRFVSVLIMFAVIFSFAVPANAAQTNLVQTGTQQDIAEQNTVQAKYYTVTESASSLPSYYSSKGLGLTMSVRAQDANNCWAFGAVSSLETFLLKNGEDVPLLSPQHMNHWGTKDIYNETGWFRTYLDGGYPYIATGYLTSWSGAVAENEYPQTTPYDNYNAVSKDLSAKYGVTGIVYLDGNDKNAVKSAIMNYGAVTANYHTNNVMYYNNSTASYYCYGKYDANTSGSEQSDDGTTFKTLSGHCISIVGWDDNYSKNNFKSGHLPATDGAWLVKNSAGTYFGNNGYFWISYCDNYLFDEIFGMNYAYCDYEKIDSDKKLYQNEVYGATYEYRYIELSDITYSNVFDFGNDFTSIDKIVFESTSLGAKYTIYYIPISNDKPTNFKSKWIKLGEGTVDYEGYICADIDDYKVPDGKGAIGININTNGLSVENGIGVNEWLSNGAKQLFVPESTYGQSFVTYSGNTKDVMQVYNDYLNDSIGGTFVIKAITNKVYSVTLLGDSDLDGRLTISDVTLIQKYQAGVAQLSKQAIANADYNCDGKLTIFDATMIQRKLAKLI